MGSSVEQRQRQTSNFDEKAKTIAATADVDLTGTETEGRGQVRPDTRLVGRSLPIRVDRAVHGEVDRQHI